MSDITYGSEKQSPAVTAVEPTSKSSDLPASRPHKNMAPVTPPLAHTPLRRLIYYLAAFALIVMAFYSWRMFQWKTEYGGWWNLALSRRPPGTWSASPSPGVASPTKNGRYAEKAETVAKGSEGRTLVEDNIQALADALGMPSADLADVIADAVREHVPPASLSSVAAHEPSGTAAQYLVNPDAAAKRNKVAGTVRSAFEAAVGMDEPQNDFGGE